MAKPRIEVQIAAEVGNALNGLKRATEAINQFKNAAGAAGGKITVSLGNAAKRAGTAARQIETEFSDSFAEIDAAIRASGVNAGNWSNQVSQDAKDASRAIATFGNQATNSLDRAAKSLQRGFGRGIIHPSIQSDLLLLDKNLQRVSLTANKATSSLVGVGRQGAAGIRGGTSAAISFGHIIQDLPYGINGVANNITQLTTQMGYMASSAKAAGVSMRTALLQSITNPATLAVLGISVLTTAIVHFTGRVGKAKKETGDLADTVNALTKAIRENEASLAEEQVRLRNLRSIAEDANIPLKDRLLAVQNIKKEYPSYFKAFTDEQILAGRAADAYVRLAAALTATASARAHEEAAMETAKQRLKTEENLAKVILERTQTARELANFEAIQRENQQAGREGVFVDTQVLKLRQRIADADASILAYRTQLRKESAQIIDYNKEAVDILKSAEGAFGGFLGGGEENTDAAKRLKEQQKEAEKLAAALKKSTEESFMAGLSAQDKANELIRLKYEERKAMAGLTKEDLVRLENAQAQEILALNAKFEAQRLQQETKFREKLAELQRKSFLAGLPDEDAANERIQQQFEKILSETQKNYQELLALAGGNQAEITELNAWYAQRRIEIANEEAAAIMQSNNEFAQKRLAEETKRREAERKAQEKAMRDMTNLQEEWARTLSRQLEGVLFEGENFFESLGNAFKRMISQMIADALAADIAGALFSGKGSGIGGFLGGIFGGGLFGKGGGIGKLFGGLLNLGRKFGGVPFANGGIVSGPTLGLVGEYPGARSNPEVISPLSDLQKYIDHTGVAGRVIVEGQISNDVIHLSNQRGARTNKRFFGGS